LNHFEKNKGNKEIFEKRNPSLWNMTTSVFYEKGVPAILNPLCVSVYNSVRGYDYLFCFYEPDVNGLHENLLREIQCFCFPVLSIPSETTLTCVSVCIFQFVFCVPSQTSLGESVLGLGTLARDAAR
jgi:hypothetical protein